MTYYQRCTLCFILALLFCSAAGESRADQRKERSFDIAVTVDKEIINIGDRVTLKIIAENISGYDVVFPEILDEMPDFSFVGSKTVTSGWPRRKEIGREYVLTSYDTGTHAIPPIKILHKKTEETDWQTIESRRINIEVEALISGEAGDIKDIKGIAYQKRSVFWIVLILFLIIGAIIAVWIRYRNRKMDAEVGKIEAARSAHEIAYEALSALKKMNLPEQGLMKEYYSRLSDIIRVYIENRFSLRAPEMTTEEFMETVKISSEMSNEHKKVLKKFLNHCDMVKFAKYGPTKLEILDSYSSAENFVDKTRTFDEEDKDDTSS